jgi:hypothetical protein
VSVLRNLSNLGNLICTAYGNEKGPLDFNLVRDEEAYLAEEGIPPGAEELFS